MQQYLDLLQTIKEKGTIKEEARKGMPGTISLFGYQFRHNLKDGFPLLTTKKLSWNNIVVELLSFLRGDETIEFLQNEGCKIWNDDVKKFDPVDGIHWGKQYPYLWRNFGGKLEKRKRDKSKYVLPELINEIVPVENPKIYTTRSYGSFQVIKKTKDEKNNNICKIQFLTTGYITKVRENRLGLDIYDPYYPSFCGVACLGEPMNDTLSNKLKIIWKGMIQRCYDEKKDNYKYYGGRGITVCNRWKCFENFNNDVRLLLNWEHKIKDWENYELDKDFKKGDSYSPENCIWIHQEDNKRQKVLENKYVVKNDEFGITESFEISQDIIKKYNLHQGNFNSMLRGERPTAQGWYLVDKQSKEKGVDQIKNLIEGLKKNPMSRRHIISAWNPATLDDMALNACHTLVQFNCRPIPWEEKLELAKRNPNVEMENLAITEAAAGNTNFGYVPQYYLDCQLYQRSADSFLGVPYNIASYALMTHIFAKITNMVPGELVHTFGDVHIYDNHKQQVDVQLARTPKDLPTLKIVDEGNDWAAISNLDFDLIEMLGPEDFIIEGYNPHPSIKGKLSTGLK